MNTKQIKLIIWDWYNTLSTSHLYESLQKDFPSAFDLVQNYFIANNHQIQRWQKGELTYREMHKIFSELTGLPESTFDESLRAISQSESINPEVLKFVSKFRDMGITQVIATDNYDVWDEFFLPQYSLELGKYFQNIYNTSKYRMLKEDEHAGFIELILREQLSSYPQSLLIDDSEIFTNNFASRGGLVINHSDQEDLLKQLAAF